MVRSLVKPKLSSTTISFSLALSPVFSRASRSASGTMFSKSSKGRASAEQKNRVLQASKKWRVRVDSYRITC